MRRGSHDNGPGERGLGGSYHKVLAASAVSNLGDGIGAVAYPWLATAITRNPALSDRCCW